MEGNNGAEDVAGGVASKDDRKRISGGGSASLSSKVNKTYWELLVARYQYTWTPLLISIYPTI